MMRLICMKLGSARVLFSYALHTFFLLRRGLTLGVRAVVISDNAELLLVRHTYTPGWHLPGGGVEKGEAAERALSNELMQETNLRLNGQPILHGVFYNQIVSKRDHVLVYLCEVNDIKEASPNSFEIAELGFFDIGKLPEDTDPGTLRRINEICLGYDKALNW